MSIPKDTQNILQLEYKELEQLNDLLADFSCFLQGVELAGQLGVSSDVTHTIKRTLDIEKIRRSRRAVMRELNRFKINPVYK